ncbi:sensor histidine kinase [Nocardia salmonicida]
MKLSHRDVIAFPRKLVELLLSERNYVDDTTRVTRLIARFIGLGYLIYLPLLTKDIRANAQYLDAWWTPAAVVAIFLPPTALLVMSYRDSAVAIHRVATAMPPLYLLAACTWLLAWNGELSASPLWLAAIPALAAMAGAIVWRPWWTITYLSVLIFVVHFLGRFRAPEIRSPFVLEWLFSWSFSLVYVAGILMMMHTARVLDATRAASYEAAAQTEVLLKHESDRTEMRAFLHDGVIFGLTMASELGDDKVRSFAQDVLDDLDQDIEIIGAESSTNLLSMAVAIERIEENIHRFDSDARIQVVDVATSTSAPFFEARTVHAIRMSVGEAIRNSLRHAGAPARRTVRIAPDHHRLSVVVEDDGVGFDTSETPDGIGLEQMKKRMAHLRGGNIDIRSEPGGGTTVSLSWREPDTTAFEEVADVRALLGMSSPKAWLVAGFFYVGVSGLAIKATTAGMWSQTAIAMLLLAISVAGILWVPGDPLPAPTAVAIMFMGAAALGVVLLSPPYVASIHQLWPASGFTAVATFMCVRGRTLSAWIMITATVAIAGVWSTLAEAGPGYGISYSLINFGPIIMAAMFAWTIRPAADEIYRLRKAAIRDHASAEVAATAIDDNNAQLRELARKARPLLQRVADPAPLTRADLDRCGNLAEELRDHLRAIGLVHPLVDPASAAARDRGVEVVMLDDEGMNEIDAAVRHEVLRTIADELNRTRNGRIAVRIVPPGRSKLATVVAYTNSTVRRVDFDVAGQATVM